MRLSATQLALVPLAICVACAAGPTVIPRVAEGVREVTDTVYYPVYGSTPREWMRSAQVEAARAGMRESALAMTGAVHKWTSSTHVTEYGCVLRNPQVILGVRFVMPRLASDSGVNAGDGAAWQGLVRTMWRHEEVHAAVALRAATEFHDSLRVIHADECGFLRSHAEQISKAIAARAQLQQDALDARRKRYSGAAGQIAVFRGSVLAVDTLYRDTIP